MHSEKKSKIKIKGLNETCANIFVNWLEQEGIKCLNEHMKMSNSTFVLESIDEEDSKFEIHLSVETSV